MTSSPEISVVVPVFNEEGNVGEFLRRLVPLLEINTSSYEIIFSADPSTDRTEELVLAAREANPAVKLLRFSRRFRALRFSARFPVSSILSTMWPIANPIDSIR